MDKYLLKLIFPFRSILTRSGVDFDRMLIIVQTKLLMDKRRNNVSWRKKQLKDNSNQMRAVLFTYGLFGCFIGVFIYKMPFVLSMIIFHSYLLFMMAMTLITDFSTVLLDTTDTQVILPRPVNSRTLFMSRFVHIFIYLLQFTFALSIGPVIITIIIYGAPTGIAAIFTALLTILMAVFITYLLYLLVLRFSSEEKVKEIITYFQIFMTLFFAIGYQVVPRLINLNNLSSTFELHWYSYLLPPVWMALTLETIRNLVIDTPHLWMIISAVGFPIISFWLLIKYFAPSFAARLAATSQDGGTRPVLVTNKKSNFQSLSEFFASLVCKSSTEKAAFVMTWKITGRDKAFRLQFYPSLGYIVIFILIFVFKIGSGQAPHWHSLHTTNFFLWFIYMPLLTVATSIIIVSYNENYQASWVFFSTPVYKPGEILSGTLKALYLKYFTFVYICLFSICLFIWGPSIIDDFVFGYLNNFLCFLIYAIISDHYFPFSRQPGVKQQTGRWLMTILQLILIGFLVGIHFIAIRFYDWLIYVLMIPVLIGCFFSVRSVQNLAWSKISV